MPSPSPAGTPAPETVDMLRRRLTTMAMRLVSATSHGERHQILTVLGGTHRAIAEHDPAAADSLRRAFMFDLLADAERAAVIRALTFYAKGDLPDGAERALLELTVTGDPEQRLALLQQVRDGLAAADADDPAIQAVDTLLVCLRTGPTGASRQTAAQAFTPATGRARPAMAAPAPAAGRTPPVPGHPCGVSPERRGR
jgi:hypothetical protein